jgi:hypothetical protein
VKVLERMLELPSFSLRLKCDGRRNFIIAPVAL